MKPLTQLWTTLTSYLKELSDTDLFNDDLQKKLGEILDIKDAQEYKEATVTDVISPSQFAHTSRAMRRAFVEGYFLAQMEQRKDDIKTLYNMYHTDTKKELEKDTMANIRNHIGLGFDLTK